MSKASIARAASRVANKSKHQTRGLTGNRGKDGSLLNASTEKALEPWASKLDEVKGRLAELEAKLKSEIDNLETVGGYPEVYEEKSLAIFDRIQQQQLDIINKLKQEMEDSSLDIPRELVDMRADLINDLFNTDAERVRVKRDIDKLNRNDAKMEEWLDRG